MMVASILEISQNIKMAIQALNEMLIAA